MFLDVNARHEFIEDLCNNFHYEGCKDDIIGLVTHTEHGSERRPLVISTLTRKFYIRPSEKLGHRGHRYDLHMNHGMVFDVLKDLLEKITAIQEQQQKFKKHIEQRRKWLTTTSPSPSHISSDNAASKIKSVSTETNNSRRVSATSSNVSSVVDSKIKPKKVTVVKKRPKWRI